MGVCRPVLQILTLFQTNKCYFPYPFSDLAFRQKLCHHYQIRAETKKFFKYISNSHISFRSYSFGIATINTFIQSRSSLANHTRFQTKKRPRLCPRRCVPVFRPKRPEFKTLPVGAANTYMAYIREYPPAVYRISLEQNMGVYHLTENFENSRWKVNGKVTFRKFQPKIEEYVLR